MSPLAYRTSVAEEDLGVPGQSRLLYRAAACDYERRAGRKMGKVMDSKIIF